jgi:hypothetical protein
VAVVVAEQMVEELYLVVELVDIEHLDMDHHLYRAIKIFLKLVILTL